MRAKHQITADYGTDKVEHRRKPLAPEDQRFYDAAVTNSLPVLIQGGMGVGVSGWQLARAVSEAGQLGVVSGTALDLVLTRRLQIGDPGGHMRRALAAYPIAEVAERIIDRYFIAGGKPSDARFVGISMKREDPTRNLEDLLVASNFVEVYLAKEGHTGEVGINYLEKVQAPTLPSLYGAMLAGVDYVLMGAGIPRMIPVVLDRLAEGLSVEYKLDVKGAGPDGGFTAHFDPDEAMYGAIAPVKRPLFLAIVSSHVLATMLARKVDVPVDGFIVEGSTAGGHNAPPRGKRKLNEAGEPIYGDRDVADLEAFRELGLPFWLAGGYSYPDRVREALDAGAAGVQIGTPFAYCEESGMEADSKRHVLDLCRDGEARVFTDPQASPSGFPFKVVEIEGTLSEPDVYEERDRVPCELGYLRSAHEGDDGGVVWRCAAEPVDLFVRKGGAVEDTVGSKCLCNALLANVGLGQIQRSGAHEQMLITSGDEVADVARFLPAGAETYFAADVIRQVLPAGIH
ncbi:MAG: nitronate monooxygenase [Actinobacteria bacterium]|nr:nitronate monooxygenase [Actinomycetota bacterium]